MSLDVVTQELAARAAEHDRDGSFPYDGIAVVHKHGLLTATVAARYGGEGAGLARTVDILSALGAGEPARVRRVDHRPGRSMDLRGVLGADHADELDRHGVCSFVY